MIKQNQRQNFYALKSRTSWSFSLTCIGPDDCLMVGVLLGLKHLCSLGPAHANQYFAPENEKAAVKMKPKDAGNKYMSILFWPSWKVWKYSPIGNGRCKLRKYGIQPPTLVLNFLFIDDEISPLRIHSILMRSIISIINLK